MLLSVVTLYEYNTLYLSIHQFVVEKYFGKKDQTIKDKIALVCYIHMVWWNKVNTPDNQKRLEGCRSRLIELLDKYDDVKIG